MPLNSEPSTVETVSAPSTAVAVVAPAASAPPTRRSARRRRPRDWAPRHTPPLGSDEDTLPFTPSRWMTRFVPQLVQLNAALQRLEDNTFTLLGMPERGYLRLAPALRRFLEALHAYRQTTRQLTAQAQALSRGQVEQTEPDDATPPPVAVGSDVPGATEDTAEEDAAEEVVVEDAAVPTLDEELAAWPLPALATDALLADVGEADPAQGDASQADHSQEDGDAPTPLA